jgi:hypothetical protein
VWELPGLPSSDPESEPFGDTGKLLGNLEPCARVAITNLAWSDTDEEFYVFVETNAIKGWVPLELITLNH